MVTEHLKLASPPLPPPSIMETKPWHLEYSAVFSFCYLPIIIHDLRKPSSVLHTTENLLYFRGRAVLTFLACPNALTFRAHSKAGWMISLRGLFGWFDWLDDFTKRTGWIYFLRELVGWILWEIWLNEFSDRIGWMNSLIGFVGWILWEIWFNEFSERGLV